MNPSRSPDDRPFDNPALEREWLAQEAALRAERDRADTAHDDARQRSYRAITRALREPLPAALPADFAVHLARHVATQARADVAFATPFERIAIGVLIALFGIAIGIAVAVSASTTLQPVSEAVRQVAGWGSKPWLVALAACLAVSSALQRWLRGAHPI